MGNFILNVNTAVGYMKNKKTQMGGSWPECGQDPAILINMYVE